MPDTDRLTVGFVLPPTSGANKYGWLDMILQVVSGALEQAGIPCVCLESDSASSLKKIISFSNKENSALFFSIFGYEAKVNGATLIEQINCPAYSTLGDHPFTNFCHERVLAMQEPLNLFTPSLGIKNTIRVMNPSYASCHVLEGWLDGWPRCVKKDLPSFSDRQFDVLVPLDFRESSLNILRIQEICDATNIHLDCIAIYDELYSNRDEYPFDIFSKAFKSQVGFELSPDSVSQDIFLSLLSVLGHLDMKVRSMRRIHGFLELAPFLKDKKTLVLSKYFDGLPQCPGITYKRKVNWPEYFQALADSRVMFNVSATFTDQIPERIAPALLSGCKIISDRQPALEQMSANLPFVQPLISTSCSDIDMLLKSAPNDHVAVKNHLSKQSAFASRIVNIIKKQGKPDRCN